MSSIRSCPDMGLGVSVRLRGSTNVTACVVISSFLSSYIQSRSDRTVRIRVVARVRVRSHLVIKSFRSFIVNPTMSW